MPTMRSRVDCGFSLTMLSFWPTMRVRSGDFPALGLPTTVRIPARGIRQDSCSGQERGLVPRRCGAGGPEHTNAPDPEGPGTFEKVPATAYSPALSRAEYHRRCRA